MENKKLKQIIRIMILKNSIIYKLLLLCILNSSLVHLFAQDIKKEVYVVSTFRPEVADADKISALPSLTDTLKLAIGAEYTVLPSHLKSSFEPRTIKPATMVGTPLDKLYNSSLKLGLGNYATPLVQFNIQNLRSKEYAIGAQVYHKSSHDKLALANGDKVPAGYGITEVSAYGKKFVKNSVLGAQLGASSHQLRYYGYNTANFPDSFPNLESKDIKQFYNSAFGQIEAYSSKADTDAFNYRLVLRGEYFRDYYKNKEPNVNAIVNLSYPVNGFVFGTEANMNYYNFSDTLNTYSQNLVEIKPFINKHKAEWELKLGANLSFENSEKSKFRIFPEANMRFQMIQKVVIFNVGVNGYVQQNNYRSLAEQNPYILPGLKVENTLHKFIGYGGIEGQLSSKAWYKLDVTFDVVENDLYFVNDTLSPLQNHFITVYNDDDQVRYRAEFTWIPTNNLTLLTQFKYNKYGTEFAWHKPKFEMGITARYNLKEKIYADIDFLVYGKRLAPNTLSPANPIVLDPIYDLNLKLEYRYSSVFSGFFELYNLTGQKYYLWNQYPSQRLNVLLGVTYKF